MTLVDAKMIASKKQLLFFPGGLIKSGSPKFPFMNVNGVCSGSSSKESSKIVYSFKISVLF